MRWNGNRLPKSNLGGYDDSPMQCQPVAGDVPAISEKILAALVTRLIFDVRPKLSIVASVAVVWPGFKRVAMPRHRPN